MELLKMDSEKDHTPQEKISKICDFLNGFHRGIWIIKDQILV